MRGPRATQAEQAAQQIRQVPLPEQVLQVDVLDVASCLAVPLPRKVLESARGAARALILLPAGAQLVVAATLLRIRQYLVGFVDVLEALLGSLISWVDVGM